jgi:hypothetical protein
MGLFAFLHSLRYMDTMILLSSYFFLSFTMEDQFPIPRYLAQADTPIVLVCPGHESLFYLFPSMMRISDA